MKNSKNEEEYSFLFQKFNRKEYIEAKSKEEALRIYKKKHAHDVSQIKSWVWNEEMNRFIVAR